MEYIYVGDIVNTHGLKGELRILSDFLYKKEIFKTDFKLYIGGSKEEMMIKSYRPHKNYDMVFLDGVNDISEAIIYKGDSVYVKKNDFNKKHYFDEDYIGLEVYSNNNLIGKVTDIISNKAHKILVVNDDEHKYLIPNVKEFIHKIDVDNKRLDINEIEGLLDEN